MSQGTWFSVKLCPPLENSVVETKIEDKKGTRNVAKLKLYKNLWWESDSSTYVYYTPTHWRYC